MSWLLYLETESRIKGHVGEARFHEEIDVRVNGEQGICIGPIILGNVKTKKAYVLFHESEAISNSFASSIENAKNALTALPNIDRVFGVKILNTRDPNCFSFIVDEGRENEEISEKMREKLRKAISDRVVSVESGPSGEINFTFIRPPEIAYTTSFGPHRIFKNTIDFLYKTRVYMTIYYSNLVNANIGILPIIRNLENSIYERSTTETMSSIMDYCKELDGICKRLVESRLNFDRAIRRSVDTLLLNLIKLIRNLLSLRRLYVFCNEYSQHPVYQTAVVERLLFNFAGNINGDIDFVVFDANGTQLRALIEMKEKFPDPPSGSVRNMVRSRPEFPPEGKIGMDKERVNALLDLRRILNAPYVYLIRLYDSYVYMDQLIDLSKRRRVKWNIINVEDFRTGARESAGGTGMGAPGSSPRTLTQPSNRFDVLGEVERDFLTVYSDKIPLTL